MKTIIVSKKNNGKKLNNVILSEFKSLSINSLYKALRKKDIRINGIKTSENIAVYQNDKIDIYISDEFLLGLTNSNIENSNTIFSKEDILYEDSNIIAINKSCGIEVIRFKLINYKLNQLFTTSCFSMS